MDPTGPVRWGSRIVTSWHVLFSFLLSLNVIIFPIFGITELLYVGEFFHVECVLAGMLTMIFLIPKPPPAGELIMLPLLQYGFALFTNFANFLFIAYSGVKQWNLWFKCGTASFWVWPVEQFACDNYHGWWIIGLAIAIFITTIVSCITFAMLIANAMTTHQQELRVRKFNTRPKFTESSMKKKTVKKEKKSHSVTKRHGGFKDADW